MPASVLAFFRGLLSLLIFLLRNHNPHYPVPSRAFLSYQHLKYPLASHLKMVVKEYVTYNQVRSRNTNPQPLQAELTAPRKGPQAMSRSRTTHPGGI